MAPQPMAAARGLPLPGAPGMPWMRPGSAGGAALAQNAYNPYKPGSPGQQSQTSAISAPAELNPVRAPQRERNSNPKVLTNPQTSCVFRAPSNRPQPSKEVSSADAFAAREQQRQNALLEGIESRQRQRQARMV